MAAGLKMYGRNIFLTIAVGVCIVGGGIHFFAANWNASLASEQTAQSADSLIGAIPEDVQPNAEESSSRQPETFPNQDIASTAEQILADDPEDDNGRYAALLDELCRSGEFQTALTLSEKASADLHASLLKNVFYRWAQSRPQEAIKSLDAITDPQLHSAALRAAANGWNTTSPGDLATFAFALPPGGDRDYALGAALDNWSLQDPAALGAWLNAIPQGNEFDYGAATMIEKTDAVNRSPEVAMEWVENITDPALKQNALLRVLYEWMQSDSVAARQYVARAAWLDESQRRQILENIPSRAANDK